MRRIVHFITVALALGMLAVLLASMAPKSANAAVARLVQVVNFPATQPVSGAVAVSNLPATQPVSGTVAVSNLPATQSVSGTVNVGNLASDPVHVDNGERNVVRLEVNQFTFDGSIVMSDSQNGIPYTVPSGQRLVIENVSVFAAVLTGRKVSMSFSNGVTKTFVAAVLQGSFSIPLFPADFYQNSMLVRDYVEPGGVYVFTVYGVGAAGANVEAYAVGHLVDCTNGGGC